MSHLGKAHFEEWPVWSEYYDFDELEEIEEWGIAPATFWAELKALNLGNEHAAYPALRYDPLPVRMRIYIKARFTTQRGDVLSGFVINEDAYSLGIFIGDEELGFNVSLPSFWPEMLERLARHLHARPEELLPIHFEADVKTAEGVRIAGFLNFPPASINDL